MMMMVIVIVVSYMLQVTYYQEQWAGMQAAPNAVETWDTGVDTGLLQVVGHASVSLPDNFVSNLYIICVC